MRVTVLGAGAMGSALTIPLADNDHRIALWGTSYDQEILDLLESGSAHPRIGVQLPNSVDRFGPDELQRALDGSDVVVLGVSSAGVVPVGRKVAPYLDPDVPLVTIAKGLIEVDDRPRLLARGLRRLLENEGFEAPPLAAMGGPSIAAELAQKSPTAVQLAAGNEERARELARHFDTEYFRLKPTEDLRGLETCVGFKNPYAVALAWPTGLSEREGEDPTTGMTNLKAILFLQILEELKLLAGLMGGRTDTVMDLPGLGDLVTTSTAGRNGSFGRLLGAGKSPDEALGILEEQGVGVIEGYETAQLGQQLVKTLADNQDVTLGDLPLLREINLVMYQGKSVEEAVREIRL